MFKATIKQRDLYIKTSTLLNSGLGLFTSKPISKGTLIVEYTGKVSSWKDAENNDGNNGYLYYVTRNHVIDARRRKKALARYANDARGLSRHPAIKNNAEYEEIGKQVFIKATRDIPAGSEILVAYGKEYWDVIRHNKKLETRKP